MSNADSASWLSTSTLVNKLFRLLAIKPAANAKWVVFYSFADGPVSGRYYDCHPIASMDHELTILAYEMNGAPLNESHGAPVRLRNEVELGFKHPQFHPFHPLPRARAVSDCPASEGAGLPITAGSIVLPVPARWSA